MTLSKIGKLKRRFERYLNNEAEIDPITLLNDLIQYQGGELIRSTIDGSIQSEQDHKRLKDQLESMIGTLSPETKEVEIKKRRLP